MKKIPFNYDDLELKPISLGISISEDEKQTNIVNTLSPYINLPTWNALCALTMDLSLIPDYQDQLDGSIAQAYKTPLLTMITSVILNEEKKPVKEIKNGGHVKEQAMNGFQLLTYILYGCGTQQLLCELGGRVDFETTLTQFVLTSPWIKEEDNERIESLLQSLFDGNMRAFINSLTPAIERILKDLAKTLEISIYFINKETGIHRPKTLGTLLNEVRASDLISTPLKKVLIALKAICAMEFGPNMRNEILHGHNKTEQQIEVYGSTLLILFLHLITTGLPLPNE